MMTDLKKKEHSYLPYCHEWPSAICALQEVQEFWHPCKKRNHHKMFYRMKMIWTAEIQMKWRFDHRSCNRNLGNCKFKPEKKISGLQQDSNPWPLRYRCSALPTELWRPIYWEQTRLFKLRDDLQQSSSSESRLPVPATHQCCPGSIPGLGVICGLSLLLVLVLARGFFLQVLWFFPPSSKTNYSKFQFYPEAVEVRATSWISD